MKDEKVEEVSGGPGVRVRKIGPESVFESEHPGFGLGHNKGEVMLPTIA